MRHWVFGLSLAALFPTLAMQGTGQQPSQPSASSAAQQEPKAQPAKVSAKAIADAGALFQKACASCHFVPSDRELTDVTWVGQIRETS